MKRNGVRMMALLMCLCMLCACGKEVPEEAQVRDGKADYTGRVCVIGTDLKEKELLKLFHI